MDIVKNTGIVKILVYAALLQLSIFVEAYANPYSVALESAIIDYKKIAENSGWPHFTTGKTIKPSEHDDRVVIIRKILSITGDYQGDITNDSTALDDELVEAIKKFQERHGLDTDGAIGAKTGAALAVSVEYRIAQMQVALEDMQEMPEPQERYVLVNIPAFHLKAVHQNKTVIDSRVIVGTAKNPTPIFDSKINNINFNPDWHVPYSIARNEFMEKLRLDPEYFENGNYVIKDSDGEEIEIYDVDWESYSGEVYSFMQRSGVENALGKVKFNLINSNNIYLHSTGSPKLFTKSYRALSHGCIRVEKARELVSFAMSGKPGWDEERISSFYDSDKSRTILVTPLDVHVVYWTSWVDESTGKPHFYDDIYRRNKKRIDERLLENRK